jgi:hypothetical protein
MQNAKLLLAIFACFTIAAFGLWRIYDSYKRTKRNPMFHRRRLIRFGILCGGLAAFALLSCVIDRTVAYLAVVPIPALSAWLCFRAANKLRLN